jgi:hypothetical protein
MLFSIFCIGLGWTSLSNAYKIMKKLKRVFYVFECVKNKENFRMSILHYVL